MTLLIAFGSANVASATQTPGGPEANELSTMLGVRVDQAPGEINQYLIRARQGSVDLSKLGKIQTDLGYAVGLTLPNGVQIGFRYESLPGEIRTSAAPKLLKFSVRRALLRVFVFGGIGSVIFWIVYVWRRRLIVNISLGLAPIRRQLDRLDFLTNTSDRFSTVVVSITDSVALSVCATLVLFLIIVYADSLKNSHVFSPYSLPEESAYTYTSARNFIAFGYLNSGFLQDFATSAAQADHPYVYDHMPPGPDILTSILLNASGGKYTFTRIVFSTIAVVGFVVYLLFARLLLAEYSLKGAGLIVLFLGPWILLQIMERQIYSPFPLLAFLPMYFYGLCQKSHWQYWRRFYVGLFVICVSAFYLEYSLSSGFICCWF